MTKGVRNLKTSSGRVTRPGARREARSYELFMQVTCLEMEKARRSLERTSAMKRVEEIDQRLVEIEESKARLLEGLVELRQKETPSPDLLASAESADGFRIRY